MVALLNAKGGRVYVGVDDDGSIHGLRDKSIDHQSKLIANAATHHVTPPVGVFTENVATSEGVVIVVSVDEGTDKPYQASDGFFYVKRAEGNRKVSNRSELLRMFQAARTVYAEPRIVEGSSLADLDRELFARFYREKYTAEPPGDDEPLIRELTACRLMNEEALTVAGLLLFGTRPQYLLPEFVIKAVSFRGVDRAGTDYYDNRRFEGNIATQYEQAMAFLRRWNARIQNGGSFNEPGRSEVPDIVFEELVTNALVHRDYFVQDSVKVFIFDDRLEIRSPGRLPNSLTVEQIRRGIHRERNQVIQSFAFDVLNYRGLGSGILRAIKAWPGLSIVEDIEGEEMVVTIPWLRLRRRDRIKRWKKELHTAQSSLRGLEDWYDAPPGPCESCGRAALAARGWRVGGSGGDSGGCERQIE